MTTDALRISELELRIREKDSEIRFLEETSAERDKARLRALGDLLKKRDIEILELKSEIKSKDYEIDDLESDLSRQEREYDKVLEKEHKTRLAFELVAMREIAAALPNPATETYDQFMFRRNLRILFTSLGSNVRL